MNVRSAVVDIASILFGAPGAGRESISRRRKTTSRLWSNSRHGMGARKLSGRKLWLTARVITTRLAKNGLGSNFQDRICRS